MVMEIQYDVNNLAVEHNKVKALQKLHEDLRAWEG
jgi:hypothetical protein